MNDIEKIIRPVEKEVKDFIKDKFPDDLKNQDDVARIIFDIFKSHWVFKKKSFRMWIEHSNTNPFVKIILARSGLLPLYVLHLLQSKEMFGNEIMGEIEERTHSACGPNPGAIYPLLKELEKEKFVECRWDTEKERPIKIYKITEKGKKEYEVLKKILKNKFKKSLSIFNEIYDDIYSEQYYGKRQDEKKL